MIRRWREIERWIENAASAGRTSSHPMLPLSEVLSERREPVQLTGTLGDWQAITVKFSGEVLPRVRTEAFKGAMFAAYPGDLVFSKIDARNGAVGLIPASIPKAVVTSEYPVFTPIPDRLRAEYLNYLLRAEHFQADLKRKASGTSGRKRVTPEEFEPPRISRRLRLLREWSDDESNEVFPGGPGAGGEAGPGAPGRVRITVGGDRLGGGEDRLHGRDVAYVGSAA